MRDLTDLRDIYGFLLVRCHDRLWKLDRITRGEWELSDPLDPNHKITSYNTGCQWCKNESEYINVTKQGGEQ